MSVPGPERGHGPDIRSNIRRSGSPIEVVPDFEYVTEPRPGRDLGAGDPYRGPSPETHRSAGR